MHNSTIICVMTINISWIYINIGHIKIYAFSEIYCVWILFFFFNHIKFS